MSKKKIVLILLAIIFGGYAGWQLLLPNEPIINIYKWKYDGMSKPEYLQRLRDFCTNEIGNSIDNLNYSELVEWEHKYLTYTEYQFNREDMPIAILEPYLTDRIAFGRCGEFALCINGLLLANGYKTRLIVDSSKAITKFEFNITLVAKDSLRLYMYPDQKAGKILLDSIIVKVNDSKIDSSEYGICSSNIFFSTAPKEGSSIHIEFEYYKNADDHVWVEVWADNRWIHIDPTEQRFDDNYMYYNDWNKEINDIKAITKNSSGEMEVIDVTQDYIPKP